MPDLTLLMVFIPTFFFVSITPGMCMTLAMTLGMRIGVRRTLWMMIGELAGVSVVAIAAVLGVASMMLSYPELFKLLKWLGGTYLIYIGITMWRDKGQLKDIKLEGNSRWQLISQGFVTAIANPKGWAFMVSLLPPFINSEQPIAGQLLFLLAIIMLTEFSSMLAYATGGKGLRVYLLKGDNIKWLNRLAGSLILLVGIWLILS
jgi:homoserine/homoserine lactone efflux protein